MVNKTLLSIAVLSCLGFAGCSSDPTKSTEPDALSDSETREEVSTQDGQADVRDRKDLHIKYDQFDAQEKDSITPYDVKSQDEDSQADLYSADAITSEVQGDNLPLDAQADVYSAEAYQGEAQADTYPDATSPIVPEACKISAQTNGICPAIGVQVNHCVAFGETVNEDTCDLTGQEKKVFPAGNKGTEYCFKRTKDEEWICNSDGTFARKITGNTDTLEVRVDGIKTKQNQTVYSLLML